MMCYFQEVLFINENQMFLLINDIGYVLLDWLTQIER